MDKLNLVAKALLKYETLNAEQFVEAYNGRLDLSEEDDEDIEETIEENFTSAHVGHKSKEVKEAEIVGKAEDVKAESKALEEAAPSKEPSDLKDKE